MGARTAVSAGRWSRGAERQPRGGDYDVAAARVCSQLVLAVVSGVALACLSRMSAAFSSSAAAASRLVATCSA
jgi:hypothetical protein